MSFSPNGLIEVTADVFLFSRTQKFEKDTFSRGIELVILQLQDIQSTADSEPSSLFHFVHIATLDKCPRVSWVWLITLHAARRFTEKLASHHRTRRTSITSTRWNSERGWLIPAIQPLRKFTNRNHLLVLAIDASTSQRLAEGQWEAEGRAKQPSPLRSYSAHEKATYLNVGDNDFYNSTRWAVQRPHTHCSAVCAVHPGTVGFCFIDDIQWNPYEKQASQGLRQSASLSENHPGSSDVLIYFSGSVFLHKRSHFNLN